MQGCKEGVDIDPPWQQISKTVHVTGRARSSHLELVDFPSQNCWNLAIIRDGQTQHWVLDRAPSHLIIKPPQQPVVWPGPSDKTKKHRDSRDINDTQSLLRFEAAEAVIVDFPSQNRWNLANVRDEQTQH